MRPTSVLLGAVSLLASNAFALEQFPTWNRNIALSFNISGNFDSCSTVNVDWSKLLPKEGVGISWRVKANATWPAEAPESVNSAVLPGVEWVTPSSSFDWTVDYPAGTRIKFTLVGDAARNYYTAESHDFVVSDGSSSCIPEIHTPLVVEWPSEITTCDSAVVSWKGGDLLYSAVSVGGSDSFFFQHPLKMVGLVRGAHSSRGLAHYSEIYPAGSSVELILRSDDIHDLASRRYIVQKGTTTCKIPKDHIRHPWDRRPLLLVGIIVGSVVVGLLVAMAGCFTYRFVRYKLAEKRGIKLGDETLPTSRAPDENEV